MNFTKKAKDIEKSIIELRRYFHLHPELSMQEYQTSAKVKEFLLENNIEILTLDTSTSVAALIRGNFPGRTVALRAELDALPIKEKCSIPFRSKNEGVMHACGHDVHLACVLGAAKLLQESADIMHGNVMLILQASEENARGAKQMIDAGVLKDGPDAVFGIHTNTFVDVGDVALSPGYIQASADMFRIDILGEGGHGAFPHVTKDPITIMANLICQIQTIISRNLNAGDAGVISVCKVMGGTSPNTIPDSVALEGTIRALTEQTRKLLIQRMETICKGIEYTYGCKCSMNVSTGTPPVYNDPELTTIAEGALSNVLGREHIKKLDASMVSDDIAEFLSRVPGVLLALGVRNDNKGIIHNNHTSHFMVDEDCITVGVAAMAQIAWDYLSSDGKEHYEK